MNDPSVGVVFRPQSPPERLREVVVAAEAAGVDELWLWEDCFLEGGLTACAAALAWSERLVVGIGLLPVPLRNAAVTAMEIATLARLFPGRFVPGLGHGVLDWMAQVGEGVASPMTLLREYTIAVHDLLAGKRVDVDGRFVHLEGVKLDWPPEQVPPLMVGARGPKTLRLAGEVSDGVLIDSGNTAEQAAAAIAIVAEGAASAGRPAPRIVAYVELDTSASDLAARVDETIASFGAAGVHSVVMQGSGASPDPEPLIDVIAARR
jgi:alkanesulfonate monooxygenase SsuD/methylene tetrahydromethanopterin reductase-like flavin-dependent oxidoreductase (luciferase family)